MPGPEPHDDTSADQEQFTQPSDGERADIAE
jgi:hypothetical protein